MKNRKLIIFLVFLSLLPIKIYSQGVEIQPPISAKSIIEVIERLANFVFTLILYSMPVFIVIGGLFLLTSGGRVDQIEKGKKIIFYALIGLIIAISAKGLISLFKQGLKIKKV